MREPTPQIRRLDRRSFVAGALTAGVWQAVPEGASEADLGSNLLTRMSLALELNGRRKCVFVVDTGAGRTALASDVAEAIAAPSAGDILVHGLTSPEVARSVRVARLDLGPIRFDDLVTPVFSRELLGADGLLGLDALSRFRLSFDLKRNQVEMSPSAPDVVQVSRTHATPSRLTRTVPRYARSGRFGQLIVTDATVGGVPVEAFVDSGAQYSIGNMALARAIGIDLSPSGARSVQVYGVIGQSVDAYIGSAPRLRLANQALGRTSLLFADLHAFRVLDLIERPALLIGGDVIQRFDRVVLDYGRSEISFSRPSRRRLT